MDVEELELHSDLGKSIRVTTVVTNTQSTIAGGRKEARGNSTESEAALKGEGKWSANENLETDTCEEVGYHTTTTIEAGMAV